MIYNSRVVSKANETTNNRISKKNQIKNNGNALMMNRYSVTYTTKPITHWTRKKKICWAYL